MQKGAKSYQLKSPFCITSPDCIQLTNILIEYRKPVVLCSVIWMKADYNWTVGFCPHFFSLPDITTSTALVSKQNVQSMHFAHKTHACNKVNVSLHLSIYLSFLVCMLAIDACWCNLMFICLLSFISVTNLKVVLQTAVRLVLFEALLIYSKFNIMVLINCTK